MLIRLRKCVNLLDFKGYIGPSKKSHMSSLTEFYGARVLV